MTATNPSASAGAAPPPWSLMTPDATRGDANRGDVGRGDASRGAGRGDGTKAGAGARHATMRPPEGPEAVRYDNVFGKDGLSFDDILDTLNPLQHLPVVSTIYRQITGDEISSGARLAGGALYGGPVGVLGAAINAASVESSGQDLGQRAYAALFGEEAPAGTTGTAVASATEAAGANISGPSSTTDGPAAIRGSLRGAEDGANAQLAAVAPAAGGTASPQSSQETVSDAARSGPTNFFLALQTPKTGEVPKRGAEGQSAGLKAASIQADSNSGVIGANGGGVSAGGLPPGAAIQRTAAPGAQSSPTQSNPSQGTPAETARAPETDSGPRVAGGGPTTLSPAAAQALMRMAEASAGTPSGTEPPAGTAGGPSNATAPARASKGVMETAAADPAPDTHAWAGTEGTVAPEQVPQAMMRALEKYEAMKRQG
ncbi:hypothetical protein KAJ83_14060 [Marivibrio halodurans]|uniref:Uncharacterized protein n=1 Tax=Marivibrio halodurans TaxID=2039722 RepID=A0A8J7S0M3_9PROT|nr:hypothetical protein [Marivibrio halodurans]MBP5858140.1 hypothetical protein [Marivibrio halodurans]